MKHKTTQIGRVVFSLRRVPEIGLAMVFRRASVVLSVLGFNFMILIAPKGFKL